METLAIALLGFFTLGYLVLAGADIGVGMLLPVLGRDPAERRLVIAAIAPFFLGNEVWLIAVAGVLIGAFPALEAPLVHAQFAAVVPLLIAWICRDLGLWLRDRARSAAWQALCDAAITAGSWGLALSWGRILTGLLAGGTDRVATGPAAALMAAAVATLFAVHGLAFAALRLSGRLRERARRLSGPSGEAGAFALTATAMAALGTAAGLRLPLAGTAADAATLSYLVPALLAVTPFLVAAQAWVWWLFRHRVTRPTYL